MNGWDELTLGHYDIEGRYIGLDYRQLFLDPVRAEITLAHEASHSVMAEFDIGQGARNIVQVLPYVTHLTDSERNSIRKALRDSQLFVQEGFATYMEIGRLSAISGKAHALRWADQYLHPEYKERFDKLKFAFELSYKYKEAFTSKLSYIALETGFRKHVFKNDLLKTGAKMTDYLESENTNPNKRLQKLLAIVRVKPWILMKEQAVIAELAGVDFYPPTTKEEVAEFLNYISALTPSPRRYAPSEIGETPSGEKLFANAFENTMVRNINLDLATTAEAILNIEDFLHYADVVEAIFVTEAGKNLAYKTLEPKTNPDHEIAFLAFCKTGEKYMTVTSRDRAVKIVNDELKHASILMKQGGFDVARTHSLLSEQARNPDVIIYNSPQELRAYIADALAKIPTLRFAYRHLGASEKHPFQTIALIVEGQTPLHAANGFGNKHISELIEMIRTKSRDLTNEEMMEMSRPMNDLLSVWMGLPWEIDWVKSMLNQDALYQRK